MIPVRDGAGKLLGHVEETPHGFRAIVDGKAIGPVHFTRGGAEAGVRWHVAVGEAARQKLAPAASASPARRLPGGAYQSQAVVAAAGKSTPKPMRPTGDALPGRDARARRVAPGNTAADKLAQQASKDHRAHRPRIASAPTPHRPSNTHTEQREHPRTERAILLHTAWNPCFLHAEIWHALCSVNTRQGHVLKAFLHVRRPGNAHG
jgi:hypothetical protein